MLTLLRNGFIQRSRGFVKFQIRTCSRFENFTNPLVVRSPRSGGTRSGCNPRERCGERSGADFATTFRVLPMVAQLQLKLINKTKIYIMKNSNDETFNATIGNTVLSVVESVGNERRSRTIITKKLKQWKKYNE